MGVHSGPALSVTLNRQPDYFGTTVNLAARVQRLSGGGDIVFTDSVLDDEVRALLGDAPVHPRQETLRGVTEPVQVYRWQVLEGQ